MSGPERSIIYSEWRSTNTEWLLLVVNGSVGGLKVRKSLIKQGAASSGGSLLANVLPKGLETRLDLVRGVGHLVGVVDYVRCKEYYQFSPGLIVLTKPEKSAQNRNPVEAGNAAHLDGIGLADGAPNRDRIAILNGDLRLDGFI